MFKKFIVLLFVVFVFLFNPYVLSVSLAEGAFELEKGLYDPYVEITNFKSSLGDYMIADTENGIGYLFNDMTHTYTSFPLLSGQRRHVCYIGLCYNATTPERTWVVQSKKIQGDRVTFGPTGEFLRLYFNGKRTLYGIHGHKYFEDMINSGNRFRSMGCLIVADDVLDVIENSYLANGESLMVITSTTFEMPESYK